MLDLDVMLGELERRILGFARGGELLFMHDVLAVPAVPQRQTPVGGMRLHDKLDVIVLRLVAVPQSHESQYKGSELERSYLKFSTSMRSLSSRSVCEYRIMRSSPETVKAVPPPPNTRASFGKRTYSNFCPVSVRHTQMLRGF